MPSRALRPEDFVLALANLVAAGQVVLGQLERGVGGDRVVEFELALEDQRINLA